MPPTPKPTVYRGTRYRSRLEARWAVLLDFHPLVNSWEYEPITWKLEEEGWEYTPDFQFKLATLRAYIEVKPAEINVEYRDVLTTFADSSARYPILLAVGDFYQDHVPTIENLRDKTPPERITESAWLAGCEDAVQVASAHRFDLASSSVPPPHRAGSSEQLRRHIEDWRTRERKR